MARGVPKGSRSTCAPTGPVHPMEGLAGPPAPPTLADLVGPPSESAAPLDQFREAMLQREEVEGRMRKHDKGKKYELIARACILLSLLYCHRIFTPLSAYLMLTAILPYDATDHR